MTAERDEASKRTAPKTLDELEAVNLRSIVQDQEADIRSLKIKLGRQRTELRRLNKTLLAMWDGVRFSHRVDRDMKKAAELDAAAQAIHSGESRKCAKCGFNISEYVVGEILCGACLNDQPCALCGHRYEAHDMQCHDGEAHGNRCACRTFVPSGEKE